MSDDEEYDYGSEDSVQYSDDGEEEEQQDDAKIAVENAFYEAQDLRDEDKKTAVELFNKVVTLDNEMESKGEPVLWRFKALQQLVTLYRELDDYTLMLESYRSMLNDMQLATRNECTEAIDMCLDSAALAKDEKVVEEAYEMSMTALKDNNYERQWFSTQLKLAKVHLKKEEDNSQKVEKIIADLLQHCRDPQGRDDVNKAGSLLEIYALELQLCARTNNSARMKDILPKTKNLSADVADPRIMGVINEEGGKMMMRDAAWHDAHVQLNDAFQNYVNAGQNRSAKACLKYLALSSMLSKSDINPFDGREAKVFANEADILAMTALRQHLQDNDLKSFENVLRDKKNGINDDAFLMQYIQPLRTRMREQVLVNIVRPYHKVKLTFLADELRMSLNELEDMLRDVIVRGDLSAEIEQVGHGGYLLLSKGAQDSAEDKKVKALVAWAEALEPINVGLPYKL